MEKQFKTTEESRKYFKDLGLSYNDITPNRFEKLKELIKEELEKYILEGDEHAKSMGMVLSKKEYKSNLPQFNPRVGLLEAYIQVDGRYFKNREAISFNNDGFIGFAGWSDKYNVQPFILAFIRWCDIIK
jgi:hypothetical protein